MRRVMVARRLMHVPNQKVCILKLSSVLKKYGRDATREFIRSNWDPRHYISKQRMQARARGKKAKQAWGRAVGVAIGAKDANAMGALMANKPDGVEAPEKLTDALEDAGWHICIHDRLYHHTSEMLYVESSGCWVALAHLEAAGVFTCAHCGVVALSRNGRILLSDVPVSYCGSGHARTAGAFQHENGEWYSNEDAGPPVYIYRYNQTYVGQIGDAVQYPLGLELEIEFDDDEDVKHDFAMAVRAKYQKIAAHCKRDGSLSEGGVELVTGYGSFESLYAIVSDATSIARRMGGKSHNTDTCGQHISVGRANMSAAQQARFVVFFNHTGNQAILEKFARRTSNRYARTMLDKGGDMFITRCERDFDAMLGDKYEAVNCNHDTHLEVRIFKGSLRPSTVMARVALVGLVAEFCAERRTARELVFSKFAEWMSKRSCKMSACVNEYMKRMEIEVEATPC